MHLPRRDFVERALTLAAAACARGAFAADPAATPRPAAASGSGPIRVAVVGTNNRGGNHIAGWLGNRDTELVAVCDCDPASYEKQGKKGGKDDEGPEEPAPE